MRAAGVAVLTLASASLVWTGLLRLEVIEADAMGRQFPLIGMALGHSAELALAALFGLAQPAGEATTGPVHSSVAAAGLLQFRSALLARLYLMMMMVGFTVLAALARNGKMVQFALLGGTIVAMLIGVYMVFGLARFASNAAGADAALGAAALLTLGVLIDGWMLSVVYDVMEGGYARARAAQANLMGGQTVSQLVGVSAVLALLSGLKGAARAIDEGLLADQAGGLMAMVALLFVVALGMRFAIEKVGGAGAVFIGIGALIFALVVLFKLVGLLRRLAEALEATPDRAVTDEGVFD
jgi:hypothetical protein